MQIQPVYLPEELGNNTGENSISVLDEREQTGGARAFLLFTSWQVQNDLEDR